MANDSERFPQGSIFFAGTLRQFVDKGLEDIYRTEEKVVVATKKEPVKVIFKKKINDNQLTLKSKSRMPHFPLNHCIFTKSVAFFLNKIVSK